MAWRDLFRFFGLSWLFTILDVISILIGLASRAHVDAQANAILAAMVTVLWAIRETPTPRTSKGDE